jgi:hypothetical protein
MMDHTHIADGTALRLLLAGLVLASGAVGTLGLGPVASHSTPDGPTDGPATQLAFPINNLTAAFPIDNLTLGGAAWDVRDTDPVRWTGLDSIGTNAVFRTQDMEPYAVPRSPDGLPQDMDPY